MSLRPARYNLLIWRSATFEHRFTYYSGADLTTAPVDLTGWTARLVIAPRAGVQVEISTDTAAIILGGSDGTVDLTIDPVTTHSFTWTSATYELLLTDPTGVVTALLYGAVSVMGI